MELYSAPTWVSYGQAYVVTGDQPLMEQAFEGQANGLLGAAAAGSLFLVTSTHTGQVALRVRQEEAAPDLDDAWEDVVEASVAFDDDVLLLTWNGDATPLDLPSGSYRARWCARGMDEARDEEPEERPDAYELVLWPAPPAPDAVVRQTSDAAAYWHRWVRGEPEPELPVSATAHASREGWARLVAEVRAGQQLSGERGALTRQVLVPATARRTFSRALTLYGWFGHGGSAPLEDAPGHEFIAFLGHLTMDGRYVAVDPRARTAVCELSFHWHETPWLPLLAAPSVLRLAVTAEGGASRVHVAHEGLPTEWLPAFGLLWDAQLERLAQWGEVGHTGLVPFDDW